jgi:hypothetical protein
LAFLVLGLLGFYFVIRQSNESAVANAALTKSLQDLSRDSTKIAETESQNAELQQKLLAATKENADLQTGGDSFPVVIATPLFNGTSFNGSYQPTVIVRGKHDLLDVEVSIMRSIPGENAQALLATMASRRTQTLPLVSRDRATGILDAITPQGDTDSYIVETVSRNGSFRETMTFTKNGSQWDRSLIVRDQNGKVRERQP